MNIGKTIFSQIMEHLPLPALRKCVQHYRGDYKIKTFSCLDQFLVMAFAQLSYRESLRDIEACLRAMRSKLYHMGIRGGISRNNLAHANETREWRIWADFAKILISTARTLYANEPFALELAETVYAFDSTMIDLCLSLFPWARFKTHQAAIKLHTLLDLRGPIPAFIQITEGKVHDVNILDDLIPEPGCFYIFDRGYLDFERLYRFHQALAFFVIRPRSDFQCRRLYSHPVDKSSGLISDQTIALKSFYPAKAYPENLRRVRYFDLETHKRLCFLTNNFLLPALTIAQLYKCRWQVELFFKWIKQHLRIKAFYGTSENAVKTQVWIAVSVYVLVAIIKKRLGLEISLYTILQIFSISLFEKVSMPQTLTNFESETEELETRNQLLLFN